MLNELIVTSIINLCIIVIFLLVVRNDKLSPALMAFLYSVAIALVLVVIVPNALELVGPVANFVLSYAVFRLCRRYRGILASISISVLGGLIMLYVAYLPLALLQTLVLNSLLQ